MKTEAVETSYPVLAKTAPITDADLGWWIEKVTALDWVFAVTYADGAPHEYICERTAGMTRAGFERASRVIHTFGEPQKFYKHTRIYFVHGGWKYWTMDDDHGSVNLINRGRAHHIYGAQNAPQTRSETETAFDSIATHWDGAFSASEVERNSYIALINELTGGYTKCRTLDIGAGTGLALDLGITDSFRLTAVDPSQPMLNDLVRKHPLVARTEPMTFTQARRRKVLAGTRFDLVLALGGAGSYLTDEDWVALPNHAIGRFVIAVFADGETPVTSDLTDADLATARTHAHAFAKRHFGRIERVGRFEVAVVPTNPRSTGIIEPDLAADKLVDAPTANGKES